MAVENWIDAISALWEIEDGAGGTVKSYRVFEKSEFPETITVWPCAITYTRGVKSNYSLGGPCIDHWQGVTEFHLYDNVDRSHMPEMMRWFARIRNAAAGSITLGGLVAHFMLDPSVENNILGPVVMQFGSENPHHGLVVSWTVKENVSGAFTPAA